MNVLMIEDDHDTSLFLWMQLRMSGVVGKYRIESDAHNALSILMEMNGKVYPDCIFVDLAMPGMNGFQFVEEYEQQLWHKFPDTALYILTSSTRESDRRIIQKHRCVRGFLHKPLSKQTLASIAGQLAE